MALPLMAGPRGGETAVPKRCVIWDWNGTLFDDLDLCIQVENELLDERGLPRIPSREAYLQVFGFPVRDYYRRLGFDFSQEPYEAVAADYTRRYEAACPACALCPGAEETLAALEERGLCQVLISASGRRSLAHQMAPFSRSIAPRFSAILGVEHDLAHGKRHLAEGWLAQSGFSPHQLVAVGDTLHDLEVARALGCDCILVEGGHQSPEALRTSGAPVISTLAQLPALVDRLGK